MLEERARSAATILGAVALAMLVSGTACKGQQQAASGDADVDRIVQGVAEGKRVTVTVHLAARPGEAQRDHRVTVSSVEFDTNGSPKTFHLNDRGVVDTLPAAGFRKVLVHTAPITIE